MNNSGQEGSTIYTDEYNIYNGLTMLGYTHDTVNHSAGTHLGEEPFFFLRKSLEHQ